MKEFFKIIIKQEDQNANTKGKGGEKEGASVVRGGGVGVVGSKRYKWDVKLEVFK